MRYHHSQPKTGEKKKLMGKLNEKKKWSKNAHDKEAHSNKIK